MSKGYPQTEPLGFVVTVQWGFKTFCITVCSLQSTSI